jgi:hypothetical protein
MLQGQQWVRQRTHQGLLSSRSLSLPAPLRKSAPGFDAKAVSAALHPTPPLRTLKAIKHTESRSGLPSHRKGREGGQWGGGRGSRDDWGKGGKEEKMKVMEQ